MYQELHNSQQQQQQPGTAVMQPPTVVSSQPVFYVEPSPVVCEHYDSRQSKVAGIILMVAGGLAFGFNIIGLNVAEFSYFGVGFWCATMVSLLSCFTVLFVSTCRSCRPILRAV